MAELYFSPMLLGLLLLVALAVASTALWLVSRPYSGPAFWMAGIWSLIGGIVLFMGFMATGSPTLNVLGNAGQLAGEAVFLLGIFRFMGRPLPWWIVPASVAVMVAFNIHYWLYSGSSDFLMGVYSTIAGLLPWQAIWLLVKARDDTATRPARLLVAVSLLIYSLVTLVRGGFGYVNAWLGHTYQMPYESFSYLLPYNFAIPALVMGFVGVTLMTMQRILARSEYHATEARHSAHRFERLMRASTSGVAVLRDGRIVDTNPGLEQLTGQDRDRLVGQPVSALFAEGSRDALERYLQQGEFQERELLVSHSANGALPVEVSLSALGQEADDGILEMRDISRHKALENQLNRLATHDPLTGTLNRRAFDQAAEGELERAQRYGHTFCVALLDLDHFKRINDEYGHAAGDQVLKSFATCCGQQLRTTDCLARFGGEEFIILLVDTGLEDARQLLERTRAAVHGMQVRELPETQTIRFSAGLTQWQPDDNLDSLVRRADQALYRAKRSGRDRIATAAPDEQPDDLIFRNE